MGIVEATRIKMRMRRPSTESLCAVCAHTDRRAIEAALANGETFAAIEQQFATVSEEELETHRDMHVPIIAQHTVTVLPNDPLTLTDEQRAQGATILDKMWETENLLAQGMQYALADETWSGLAALGGQRRATLESLAKMYVRLMGQPDDTDRTRAQDWAQFQWLVTTALRNFPEARAALGEAIMRINRLSPQDEDDD